MPLTTANQELHTSMEDSAATLDWAALELIEIAKRMNEAGLTTDAAALIDVCRKLRSEVDTLYGFADEVQDSFLIRIEK